MRKRKVFYFLVMVLGVSLLITGCSSDGSLPGDDDQSPTTQQVTLSGTVEPPGSTVKVSSVNSLSNEGEFIGIAKNFNTGKIIAESIEVGTDNSYSVQVEKGSNVVISFTRDDGLYLSTFVPEVDGLDNEGLANVNPESTIITLLIEEKKKSGSEVKLTSKDVDELRTNIREKGLVPETEDDFKKIFEINENNERQISEESKAVFTEINADLENTIETNKSDAVKAKEMISFVRNAGVFANKSFKKQDEILGENAEIIGNNIEGFTAEFNENIKHLFTSDFIYNLPGETDPKVYKLSELKDDSQMSEFEEEQHFSKMMSMDRWYWEITDSEGNEIYIFTDFPGRYDVDETTEIDKIHLNDIKFEYEINNDKNTNKFIGMIDINPDNQTPEKVIDIIDETTQTTTFELTIPEDNWMFIKGDYTGENYSAYLDISLEEDIRLNDISSGNNVINIDTVLDGEISLANSFKFHGRLVVDTEREFEDQFRDLWNSNKLTSSEIYNNTTDIRYLEINAKGKFDTLLASNNTTVAADYINLVSRYNSQRGELVLTEVNMRTLFESPQTWWDGTLNVERFNGLKTTEETDFMGDIDFVGNVGYEGFEDLTVSLDSSVSYDPKKETKEMINDYSYNEVNIKKGDKSITGFIETEGENGKALLTNQNNIEFSYVYTNGQLDPENSYIKDAEGKTLAKIREEDGIVKVYYYKDGSESGDFESLF